jgi:enoyl-CoA hydratase/carnithine racemase
MPYKMILVNRQDDIGTVILNRPDKRNAFNMEMMSEMDMAFEELAKDKEVKAIILTAEGRVFSAGLDFNWAATMDTQNLPPMASTVRGRGVAYDEKSFLTLVLKIQSMPKPVIAAINGLTLGGAFVLAIACDLKIASENAQFGMLQVKRGLIPDGGGTYLLPRAVGLTKALELALVGDMVDAREAERIGLVNKVVPQDKLINAARETATKIARNAPLAVAMTKAAMYRSLHEPDLAEHMDYEVYIMNILFGTEDFQEGMNSLFEKREPIFKGK